MPWTKYIPHCPHPKQLAFLRLTTREVFFGGAGGGGKSSALLMAALQYVDVPDYAAIIFRRTYADLSLPGALMDMAKDWLAPYTTTREVIWNEQKKTFTFPSGATLTFAYLEAEEDKRRYASAQLQFIAFDELTHFSESQYLFLFSRLRKLKGFDVPARMRSASNPGGRGNEWVYNRFVKDETRYPGAVFIPAKISDNPSLDEADYRASLANLDPIERARIEEGDWRAVSGGRFKRAWFRLYERRVGREHGAGEYHLDGGHVVLVGECMVFQTVDPAASAEETAKSKDPDYTVISTWAATPKNEILWLDCDRFRSETPDIVPRIQHNYDLWRPEFVGIEAVAANRAVYQEARRTNMVVRELSPGGKDKLVRATPAMVLAKDGRIYVPVVAHWKEDALAEIERFTGAGDSGHDDIVDSLSWGIFCLHTFGLSTNDGMPLSLGQRAW